MSTHKAAQIYDSGTVASGAVIATGVLDVSRFESLLLVVANADGGTRALTMDIVHSDGSTVLKDDLAVRTVGATSTETIVIANSAIATVVTAVIAMPVPVKVSFTLAASGTSNGRVTVIGR